MGLIVLSDEFGVFMSTKDGIKRLEGFSRLNFNAGVQSYIRQYFSAKEKNVDVAGALPVISYTFDRMKNNIVHDCLAEISDLGLKGEDVLKEFIFVDLSEKTEGKYKAFLQPFTVISADRRPENGFLDYSGKLISCGNVKKGFVILDDELKSGEFIAKRGGILCD